MTRRRLNPLLVMLFFMLHSAVYADSLLWREITIPMAAAGPKGLTALLVWPDLPGKHPLAIITHGSPRDAKARKDMTVMSFMPIAEEFARRGFTAAVILRRGYGHSGGNWVEGFSQCSSADYKHAAFTSAEDLHAAINYLATLPEVDVNRMIAVGVSAGGFAVVALTADSPPKGLVAAISFAGGRGSVASNTICREYDLISTFGFLGKTSRVPMLWVYAKNDHFFNPVAAQAFLQAFNDSGGKVTFIQPPDFGTEGHFLFSTKGIPLWTPLVDTFLKEHQLVIVKKLLPLPVSKPLKPPAILSSKNKKAFFDYLASPPHKAFAVDTKGAYGWRSGRDSVADARKMALDYCEKHTQTYCKIYAVDDNYE